LWISNSKKSNLEKKREALLHEFLFTWEKTYGVSLSNQDRKLFEAWDRMYPVSSKECLRDKRIYNVQGDHNPFVYDKCGLEQKLYLDE
jgi:deoxyribonuclease-1